MSHDHDHDHEPLDESPVATRVRALADRLVDEGVVTREELRKRIDWLVSRDPADGARLVARAWVDPEFKERLLADAREAALEVGLDPGPSPVGRRAREHRGRAPHGRLHALLVLSEGSARPAAGLVQEPAVPLAGRLRPARRPPSSSVSSFPTTSRCASSTRPPTFATSSSRAARRARRAWQRTSWPRSSRATR